MTLLQGVGCGQTRLSGQTSRGNVGSKRSGLTGEEDPEGTRKEARSEQKMKEPEREAKREIREEAGPEREAKRERREKARLEWEVEGEKETERRDSISPQASSIAYWQIFSFFSFAFVAASYF